MSKYYSTLSLIPVLCSFILVLNQYETGHLCYVYLIKCILHIEHLMFHFFINNFILNENIYKKLTLNIYVLNI